MKFINAAGESYKPQNWLTFNDVLLKPHRSRFSSRNDHSISMATEVCKDFKIHTPLISANMDTVTGPEMAIMMAIHGGLGILHRFYKSEEEYLAAIRRTVKNSPVWVGSKHNVVAFSVGCGEKWKSFVQKAQTEFNLQKFLICIDVAHGHMNQTIETTNMFADLREDYRKIDIEMGIIAGNVATGDGAYDLAQAGANAIKVGVGGGSICTTRLVTGHGVPQLSAIMDVREALDSLKPGFDHIGLIADGGLRHSGDIVKALAAGADTVMMGQMLAGTSAAVGEVVSLPDGSRKKLYRGQSSRHFLNDVGKKDVAAEGIYLEIPYKGETEETLKEIVGGIRSGMTYSGVGSLSELREEAEFLEISHHGWVESTPHATLKGS